MECPKCKKEMKLVSTDVSFNSQVKPRKEYNRNVYWCEVDDIWINLEVPVKK